MTDVSCDAYDNRLLQLFQQLEASRRQGMNTSGGKTKRKGDRELKRLEYSVNYDIKGGESRRGLMGWDDGALR